MTKQNDNQAGERTQQPIQLSEANVELGLESLKRMQKNDWLNFHSKLEAAIKNAGNDGEDMDEMAAENFVAGGFSNDEAAACIFILNEEVAGREITDLSMFDKWFVYNS